MVHCHPDGREDSIPVFVLRKVAQVAVSSVVGETTYPSWESAEIETLRGSEEKKYRAAAAQNWIRWREPRLDLWDREEQQGRGLEVTGELGREKEKRACSSILHWEI